MTEALKEEVQRSLAKPLFGLLDWLYMTPRLAWQDWLVPGSVPLGRRGDCRATVDPWYEQALNLTTLQLLGIFKYFGGEGRPISGSYLCDARTSLAAELPPLAPLALAALGNQAELVSYEEWRRLNDFRNRVIHQSQAQREMDDAYIFTQQPDALP